MLKRIFQSGFWWPAKGVKPYAGAVVGAGPSLPLHARAGALFFRTGDSTVYLSDGTSWTALRGVAGSCPFRLSLSSTEPFPTTDQTAKSTIYQLPIGLGNEVGLYSSADGAWLPRTIPDAGVSVAVPSTLFRGFDVFDYWDGSAIALETANWNQTTATITLASAGAPCNITTSAAHGFSVNDLIGFAGIVGTVGTDTNNGINGKVFTISATPLTTTFQLMGSDTTGLAYTSGGTAYKIPNTRTTALAFQNGRWTKSGDPTRLYAGSYMTHGTSGQTEDSVSKRLGWNYFNRRPVELYIRETEDYWTYSLAVHRPANNRIHNRVEFFRGLREDAVDAALYAQTFNDSGSSVEVAASIGLNRTDTQDSLLHGSYAGVYLVSNLAAFYKGQPALGYSYLQWLEYSAAVPTTYWYGDTGVAFHKFGLAATVWC